MAALMAAFPFSIPSPGNNPEASSAKLVAHLSASLAAASLNDAAAMSLTTCASAARVSGGGAGAFEHPVFSVASARHTISEALRTIFALSLGTKPEQV